MGIWLLIVVCSLIVSVVLANRFHRSPVAWVITTIFFGPIPLLVLLALGPKKAEPPSETTTSTTATSTTAEGIVFPETRKCPDCAEEIKWEAVVCRFCNRRFTPEEMEEIKKSWVEKRRREAPTGTCPICLGSMVFASDGKGGMGFWCSRCNKSLTEIKKSLDAAVT